MPNRDMIVLGASAGGVEALKTIAAGLPPDLPASLLIVLHIPPEGPSALSKILSRAGPLPVSPARQGEKLERAHIYVAVPDRHLMVLDSHVHLSRGPRENLFRPAVDPLFRSAARNYGNRVIGGVLSGARDDGTSGLEAIKKQGGIAIAQDPDDAIYPEMPRSAIENVQVDYVLPAIEIGSLLERLAWEQVEETPIKDTARLDNENAADDIELKDMETGNRPGKPSHFACPECGGVLWEVEEGEVLHFRCRVGHAFSADSLIDAEKDGLEDALWAALRALEEKVELSRRLAERMATRGHAASAARYEDLARESETQAELLRSLLKSHK